MANEATGPTGTDSVVLSTVARGGTDVELNASMTVERVDVRWSFCLPEQHCGRDPRYGCAVRSTLSAKRRALWLTSEDPADSDPADGVYKFTFAVVANGPSQLELLVNGVDPESGPLVYGVSG